MKKLYLLFTFLFLHIASFLVAQLNSLPVMQYPALRDIPINDLLVDAENRLWLGTEEGFYKIENFDSNYQLLNKIGIYQLVQKTDGEVWAGFYSNQVGIATEEFSYPTGIPRSELITGLSYSDGAFGIATHGGFYRMTVGLQKEIKHFRDNNSKLLSNYIYDLWVDNKGNTWLATDKGISVLDGQDWKTHLENVEVTAIAEDKGFIWAAGDRALWRRSKLGKWQKLPLPDALTRHLIRDLTFDQNGNLWIASNVVAQYHIYTDQFIIFDQSKGFTSQQALCLAVDAENNVWVGTAGKGLFKIKNDTPEMPVAFAQSQEKSGETVVAPPQPPTRTVAETTPPPPPPTTTTTNPIRPSRRKTKSTPKEAENLTEKGEPALEFPIKTKIKPSKKEEKEVRSNIHFVGRRLVKEGTEVEVQTETIEIAVWDNSAIQGDTISLYYNGEYLLKNYPLTAERQFFTLEISEKSYNYLILYAESVGILGMTTAHIAVVSKDTEDEWLILNSDLLKCDKISFKYVR